MSKMTSIGVGALLFAAAPVSADSPFDGTWKGQVQSAKIMAKPDTFAIKNGVYTCSSCKPAAYAVPADGAFHPVAGKDYWDDVAITVVNDHDVRFQYRKAGKVISNNEMIVSADGKVVAMTAHNTNNGGNVPIDSSGSMTRIGQPVAGAHLISGSWQPAPASSVSDAALTMSVKLDGDRLHMVTGYGETLDAVVGGPFALNQGDPGKTMTKVERSGPRVLRLTDMRGGKVVGVSTFTVSADGRTVTNDWSNPVDGSKGSNVAIKQ